MSFREWYFNFGWETSDGPSKGHNIMAYDTGEYEIVLASDKYEGIHQGFECNLHPDTRIELFVHDADEEKADHDEGPHIKIIDTDPSEFSWQIIKSNDTATLQAIFNYLNEHKPQPVVTGAGAAVAGNALRL
jgi:hypothetical protein